MIATVTPTLLAHTGEGASWQALVTAAAIGLVLVLLLVIGRRLKLTAPGDLVMPLATVGIVAGLGTSASSTLSDLAGYAAPVGVVALLALIGAAVGGVALTRWAPAVGVVVLAVAGSLILGPILKQQWHPGIDRFLPTRDDAVLTITSPGEGASVHAGDTVISVRIDGGSIGPLVVPVADAPSDDEELGHLHLYIDNRLVEMVETTGCTTAVPCTEVDFNATLPAGDHVIKVEFVTWDHLPFAPAIETTTAVTVG